MGSGGTEAGLRAPRDRLRAYRGQLIGKLKTRLKDRLRAPRQRLRDMPKVRLKGRLRPTP